MNVLGRTWMIPGTAQLGPEGVSYDDLIKLAFAANDIDHQVKVDMSIRVHFGAKIFGSCKRVGRKTCDGVTGTSRGMYSFSIINWGHYILYPSNSTLKLFMLYIITI